MRIVVVAKIDETKASRMKIGVIGGAGAMGSLYGGYLARAGNDVLLFDRSSEAVAAINARGLEIVEEDGKVVNCRVPATTDVQKNGPVDVAIVFVKGQHTDAAVRSSLPLIGPKTHIVSLQNGWGNIEKISAIVGEDRVVPGVSIHSVNVLAPGRVRHAGKGPTYVGELDGRKSERVSEITKMLIGAGFDAHETIDVMKVIWSKLSLNVCSLPMCALLGLPSGKLLDHDATLTLMRNLLNEIIQVAGSRGIPLDYEEQWKLITSQLERARSVRCSMLQDVENGRQTEIETITGAVVREGQRFGISTPHNSVLLWMIRALQETFPSSGEKGTSA